jgi:glycerate 2-kinase
MILNSQELATTTERAAVLDIIDAGFSAIETRKVVRGIVSYVDGRVLVKGKEIYSADSAGRFFIVGVGKCSTEAAMALELMLEDVITGGIVVDVERPKYCTLSRIQCFEGSHPFPSERNVAVSKAIKELLTGLKKDDTVLFIISGGGSTLLCLPDEKATCVEERVILEALMREGAPIDEINIVRKHMSFVRGGYMAEYAYPARVVSLIFSDVPGNDMGSVASGPTVRDTTTVAEAATILEKYSVQATCSIDYCGLIETPKDSKFFEKVENILAVSNETALAAMEEKARILGYTPKICDSALKGEAREVGEYVIRELHHAPDKTVLLYGGETTVVIRGAGKGGRNQELVLSALSDIGEGEVIASVASDGWDNTDKAGAIVDIAVLRKAGEMGHDPSAYLRNNDSYNFFKKVGGAIETGRTRSNVSDLVVALRG